MKKKKMTAHFKQKINFADKLLCFHSYLNFFIKNAIAYNLI